MGAPIPILDVAELGDPTADARLATQLGDALETVGFFFVVNHGVPWEVVESAYEAARLFHAQSLDEKVAVAMVEGRAGYLRLGGGFSRASTVGDGVHKPNLNEAYFAGFGGDPARNQWPDLAGFREPAELYMAAAADLSVRLLPLYARALGLVPDWFDAFFVDGSFSLRMSHYPVVEYEEHQWGQAAHTDSGFMTLLPTNEVPGLEIRPEGHDWIEPPAIASSFLVNSGDILRRWTNDRFLSTPHRVINRSGRDRYALPFFVGPRSDASIAAIPTCVTEGNPPRYKPILYAEYQEWFAKRNYASVVGEDGDETPP